MRSQLSTGRRMILTAVRVAFGVAALVLSGVAWATAAVVGGIAADGIAPESYEPPDRLGFFVFWIGLLAICPFVSLAAFAIARDAKWSIWRSFAAAQLGAALFAVPVFVMLAWPSVVDVGR